METPCFGSEDARSRLISLLVKFITLNSLRFNSLVFTGCINEHITKWGMLDEVELQAAASLAQIPLYVSTKGACEEV